MAQKTSPKEWTVNDSLELYAVEQWGNNYWGGNGKGHLVVHPDGPHGPRADLKELVDEIRRRGLALPLLIRFNEILRSRIVELNEAFRNSIAEYEYEGTYKGVYPIKVNQHRYVVEEILRAGQPYHYGLEAGSKPELLATMAMLEDDQALIICNGYKDEEYVETALLATRLGRTVILVVEKPSELHLIHDVSERLGIRPLLGIRAKLSTKGSGRWEASAGDRSKFGLSSAELLQAMDYLRSVGMLDCFVLLHFHLGSQISSIRSVKEAVREAGRLYVELAHLGAPLEYLDVGGGLGVDYDGSRTNFSSSMNYTMQEYANDIVYVMKEQCDAGAVPHPILVSESGRAIVAHHAVLVVDVLGVGELSVASLPESVDENVHRIVQELHGTWQELNPQNMHEAYHDAVAFKDEVLQLFNLGHLGLKDRVLAESLFWATIQKVHKLSKELEVMPEELEHLERTLSDTYFCNFSIFQSLPDSWAIDQLFPVLPIHRLNEEPTRRAVLADITCDSDGKIDRFIDTRDVKEVLELHPLTGEDYLLGIFLVGAYQEILGDMHNLFGDTNDIQVTIGADGYQIEHVLPGDTVNEVLSYVAYNRDDLIMKLRRSVEKALRSGRMTLEESRFLLRRYEEGLAGYTYLERED